MPYKVLAIDDDAATTELLSLLLSTHGFEVLMANSGRAGVEMVRRESPDVVILDLMMPEMDGWEVCKAIRAFSQVPILILSALDSPGKVASALDAGADDYLVKPVPSGVLVARLLNLVRRSDGQPKQAASYDARPAPALPSSERPLSEAQLELSLRENAQR